MVEKKTLYIIYITLMVITIALLIFTLTHYLKCGLAFAKWAQGNMSLCDLCGELGESGIIGR